MENIKRMKDLFVRKTHYPVIDKGKGKSVGDARRPGRGRAVSTLYRTRSGRYIMPRKTVCKIPPLR